MLRYRCRYRYRYGYLSDMVDASHAAACFRASARYCTRCPCVTPSRCVYNSIAFVIRPPFHADSATTKSVIVLRRIALMCSFACVVAQRQMALMSSYACAGSGGWNPLMSARSATISMDLQAVHFSPNRSAVAIAEAGKEEDL